MRFDKAFGYKQVGIDGNRVDLAIATRGELAEVDQLFTLVTIVDVDVDRVDDVLSELVDKLLLGRSSVATRCNQNGDFSIRATLPYLTKHRWNYNLARHGTGVVTCNDDNILLALGKL